MRRVILSAGEVFDNSHLQRKSAFNAKAMQIATDNADDLLNELGILYNKTRQQAITSELLDIVAGSFK